jgi:fanconi anemia group M protein
MPWRHQVSLPDLLGSKRHAPRSTLHIWTEQHVQALGKGGLVASMSQISHPAKRITIRADTRELRSGIPTLLETTHHVVVEVVQLAVGDYELGGNPLRIVERKNAADFVASIADQRLFEQVESLLESAVTPLVVLEGDWTGLPSQMHPNAVRGALTYVVGIRGIPILPSPNAQETAALLASLARQLQVGFKQPGSSPVKKARTLAEQQISLLTALPGIGPITAHALLARFGSIEQVLLASADELATMSGITSARAALLVDILHSSHVTPNTAPAATPSAEQR